MRLLWRILLVAGLIALVLRLTLGGGKTLDDRTTPPTMPISALELVADLPLPPGNIAVSQSGRVFFTFHPEGKPTIKVAELVDGKPVAFLDSSGVQTLVRLAGAAERRGFRVIAGGQPYQVLELTEVLKLLAVERADAR